MKEVFFKVGMHLNTDQENELIAILTKRCGHKTKARIRSLITYDLDTLLKNVSWLDRFYISGYDNDVHYCAGQSYPCEIRSIRQELLKRYP